MLRHQRIRVRVDIGVQVEIQYEVVIYAMETGQPRSQNDIDDPYTRRREKKDGSLDQESREDYCWPGKQW